MAKIMFLLVGTIFLRDVCSFKLFQKTVTKVDLFRGLCDGIKELPLTYENITLTTINRRVFINAKLVIRKDLGSNIKQTVLMKRCNSKDAPDTCERFTLLKFPDLCKLLQTRGQFWSKFTDAIHPPLYCPMNKGIYDLVNASFDGNSTPFPVEVSSYWKIERNLYDSKTNEHIECTYFEGQLVPQKN